MRAIAFYAVMGIVLALAWSEEVQDAIGLSPFASFSLAASVFILYWLFGGGLTASLRGMFHPIREINRVLGDGVDKKSSDKIPPEK